MSLQKTSIYAYRLAAIDIGTNAARLLISDVMENGRAPLVKKVDLFRVPLRLGFDVFETGKISKIKADKFIKSMGAFKTLMEVFEVQDFMACATSAMREAKNGKSIADKIKKQTGIEIEIIQGSREAEIIFSNDIVASLPEEFSYIYVDVGGGSTELSLFVNGELNASRSFDIGTIRMLQGQVTIDDWAALRDWLEDHCAPVEMMRAIGSGGNINKIFKMHQVKQTKPLTFQEVTDFYEYISNSTLEERLRIMKLKPDRADVIVPAAEIYFKVMKWARVDRIHVPQIGLSDGIIHVLYNRFKYGEEDV